MNSTKLIAAIFGLCLGAAAIAQDSAEDAGIPPQPLNEALKQFADNSGLQIIYVAELVKGKRTDGANPSLTAAETLDQLLASTGLEYEFLNAHTVTVQPLADEGSSDSGNSQPTPIVMSQNRTSAQRAETSRTSVTKQQTETGRRTNEQDKDTRPIEEIIVTGTNIRGIAPESSPVRVFTREDIQASGAGTAQDFIQTLPGNFGGGSNADLFAGVPNDTNAGENAGFGSSVNLRGLGSGATLVLLNGHRLAPSSSIGDFTDISMIPASAIERVEVLSDGASSIYGSDAVAGVVNFILRDDFTGLETSLRYGIGTQNRSPEEFRAGVTGGLNWDGGHGLLSYEHFNQDEIGAHDRSFSQDAFLPTFLQPGQERHSVLGSVSQDLASNLKVMADAIYSNRKAVQNSTTSFSSVKNVASSETLGVSAAGTWNPTDSWFLDIAGTYSEVDTTRENTGSSTGSSDGNSKIWMVDIKASGTVLNLPGGDLNLAFGGHYRREDFQFASSLTSVTADRDVYAAFGEAFIPVVGPDNAIAGVERLEVNVSGRWGDFSDFGSTLNPKVGVLWSPVESLNLRSSYSTSFNPPPLGTVGLANSLTVIAANTGPIFSLFGITAADPSIEDSVQLFLNGAGEDLDAETSTAFTAGLDFGHQWSRNEISMSMTWFDIEFKNRLGTLPCPGCVTGFEALNVAFNDPGFFPEGTFLFSPSQDQISDLVNRAHNLIANNPPFFGDPFDATVISTLLIRRNLASTLVSGLDFDIAYTHDTGIGDAIASINGTYMLEHKQQAVATTPVVERLNTLYNPIDLRLRGRLGLARDRLAANMFVNYVNDYRVDNTAGAMPIDSWTTVDLSVSYDTSNRMDNSILGNMVFRLSVINLFDQDPPSTPSNSQFLILGYDPTNASPLGRFIAFEMTKRWF